MVYIFAGFILLSFIPLAVSMSSRRQISKYTAVPYAIIILLTVSLLAIEILNNNILRTVYTAILGIFCVLYISFCFYVLYGINYKMPQNCSAVIIYGAALKGNYPSTILKQRLNKAYEILNHFPDAVCIVSGGKGDDEIISEAECMENYLCSLGIEKKRIFKEDKSTDTKENMIYSKAILDLLKISKDIIGVSSNYHVKRIGNIGRDCGIRIECIAVHTKGFFRLWINLSREFMSLIKYSLEKCLIK